MGLYESTMGIIKPPKPGFDLPEDVLEHLFPLISPVALSTVVGVFNVCKKWRYALLKAYLRPLGLLHLLEDPKAFVKRFGLLSPFGTWDSWLLLTFLRWPHFFCERKFVSSLLHRLRVPTARALFARLYRQEKDWEAYFSHALTPAASDDLPSVMNRLNKFVRTQKHLLENNRSRRMDSAVSISLSNFKRWNWDTLDIANRDLLISSVRIISQLTKFFPTLPTMFCVALDPAGLPMYRWIGHVFFNNDDFNYNRTLEFRISFKSASFIRVTLETVFDLQWEPTFDGATIMTGFPMYLDLTLPSALEMLYKAIGSFAGAIDPLLDDSQSLVASFCQEIESKSLMLENFDKSIQAASEAFLRARDISPGARSTEFIQTLLKDEPKLDTSSEKFPRSNLIACTRFVRRKFNQIAAQMDPIDLYSEIPSLGSQYYDTPEKASLNCAKERRERSVSRCRKSGISENHGFPDLWPTHLIHHFTAIAPDFANCVLSERQNTNLGSNLGTSNVFVVPTELSIIFTAQKRKFVSQLISSIDPTNRGCPAALKSLLQKNFQIYESPLHFERYRERTMWPVSYPSLVYALDDRLIDCLFRGSCTRELGSVFQIRYCDVSKMQLICHVCAFLRKATGAQVTCGDRDHVTGFQAEFAEFTCGETTPSVPDYFDGGHSQPYFWFSDEW